MPNFREIVRMGNQQGVPDTYRSMPFANKQAERYSQLRQYLIENSGKAYTMYETDEALGWPMGTSAHLMRPLLVQGWVTRKQAPGRVRTFVYTFHAVPVPKAERTLSERRNTRRKRRPVIAEAEIAARLQEVHDEAQAKAPQLPLVTPEPQSDRVVLAKMINNIAWDYMMSLEPSEYKLHTLVLKDVSDWLTGKERNHGNQTETSRRFEHAGSTVGDESPSE